MSAMIVPKGWEVKRFGELAKINMGQSPDSEFVNEQREGIAFLQGNAEFGAIYPSEKYWVTEPKKVAEAGEILVSVRAPVGEINRANQSYCIGRGLASLKINKLDPEYGYFAFSLAKNQLNRLAQGSTFLAISKDDLNVISILVPPKSEQQKIATILSTLDRTIEATQKLIDKEKMVKKGLMADLLTHGIDEQGRIRSPQTHTYVDSSLGMIPKGWEVKTLGIISTKMTNGFVGVATPFYVENNGVPYLYGNNIRPNKVQLEKTSLVSLEFHEKQVKSQLKPNDMLTVQSGHIGTSAIVPDGISEINCHALIITRFNQKYVLSKFISYYINSAIGMKQMSHYFVGSTILHINVGDLKKYHVPLPAKYEQEKIVAILASQDRKIETEETNLAKLQNLKKGLMGDLLSGKVRVKING